MKNLWKYILAGLATAVLCLCWSRFFDNGFQDVLTDKQSIILGVSTFLSFEMVVLTGIIVSKIEKNKPTDTEKN